MSHWIFNKQLIWGGGDGFNYILYTLIYLPFQVKPYSRKNVSYQRYLNHQHPLHWHHLLFFSQWQIRFDAGCAYENVSHMSIWQCDIAWLKQGKLNSEKPALFVPCISKWMNLLFNVLRILNIFSFWSIYFNRCSTRKIMFSHKLYSVRKTKQINKASLPIRSYCTALAQ